MKPRSDGSSRPSSNRNKTTSKSSKHFSLSTYSPSKPDCSNSRPNALSYLNSSKRKSGASKSYRHFIRKMLNTQGCNNYYKTMYLAAVINLNSVLLRRKISKLTLHSSLPIVSQSTQYSSMKCPSLLRKTWVINKRNQSNKNLAFKAPLTQHPTPQRQKCSSLCSP